MSSSIPFFTANYDHMQETDGLALSSAQSSLSKPQHDNLLGFQSELPTMGANSNELQQLLLQESKEQSM